MRFFFDSLIFLCIHQLQIDQSDVRCLVWTRDSSSSNVCCRENVLLRNYLEGASIAAALYFAMWPLHSVFGISCSWMKRKQHGKHLVTFAEIKPLHSYTIREQVFPMTVCSVSWWFCILWLWGDIFRVPYISNPGVPKTDETLGSRKAQLGFSSDTIYMKQRNPISRHSACASFPSCLLGQTQ